jgi:ABC-type dipeptide/oligopeptide/nickel transport system permease subunit
VFFLMTVLASVPSLLLLIALVMVMGRGTLQVCIALGITGWVHFCRIARGETLKLREAEFVDAARALGVSDLTSFAGMCSPISPIHHHYLCLVVHRLGAGGDHPVLSRHWP